MKNAMCLIIIFLVIWGCSKQNSITPQTIPLINNLNSLQVNYDSIETITYISEDWKAYPYAGGPGEDSLYYCWSRNFDEVSDFLPGNIVNVYTYFNGGWVELLKGYNSDSRYYYIPGNAMTIRPKGVSLWWIQKSLGTKPSSISVLVKYNPLQ